MRVAALEAAHPLRPEIARLQAVESALESLKRQASPKQGKLLTVVLRAERAEEVPEAIVDRRRRERQRVTRQTDAALTEFGDEAERRLDRLVERYRSELLALERDRQAQKVEETRERIDAESRKQLAELAEEMEFAETNASSLRAQISQPADVVFPVVDAAAFPEEMRRLRQLGGVDRIASRDELRQARRLLKPERVADAGRQRGDASFRPAARARLEAIAEATESYRRHLGGEVDVAVQLGETRRQAAVAQILQLPLEAVEARVEELRNGDESSFVMQDAAAALDRFLALEQALAGGRPSHTANLGERFQGPILPWRLPDVAAAQARTRDLRHRLERFIHEEALAAVHDMAAVQGWNVRFAPLPDIQDATGQVVRWTGWGGLRS